MRRAILLVKDFEGNELTKPKTIAWFELKNLSPIELNTLLREYWQWEQHPMALDSQAT